MIFPFAQRGQIPTVGVIKQQRQAIESDYLIGGEDREFRSFGDFTFHLDVNCSVRYVKCGRAVTYGKVLQDDLVVSTRTNL